MKKKAILKEHLPEIMADLMVLKEKLRSLESFLLGIDLIVPDFDRRQDGMSAMKNALKMKERTDRWGNMKKLEQ